MNHQEVYAGIPYEIRKRSQSKRMSLKVSHDGRVWVSVPMRVSLHDARKFVESNIAFVQATLDKVSRERQIKTDKASINEPLVFIVDGEWLPVRLEGGERFRMEVMTESDVPPTAQGSRLLVLTLPQEKTATTEALRASALQYWRFSMINRANEILPQRTLALAESFGESLRRIAVKDQKSLWGSCVKSRKSINLNWRCILFPPPVRDYLIIHELAHLRQANHSPAYWKQVEAWCPGYEAAEEWLKANGKRIMALTA